MNTSHRTPRLFSVSARAASVVLAEHGATVTPGRGVHRDRPARTEFIALLDEAFARTDTVRIRPATS